MRYFLVLLMIAGPFAGLHHRLPAQGGIPNPRNVIVMIGDGMGFNHVRALNMYRGVQRQSFESFPVSLALAHYPAKGGEYEPGDPASNTLPGGYNPSLAWVDTGWLKRDFTESAASATALATGVKTYNNAVGISVTGDTLVNLTEWAKQTGRAAGVVTSVEFCHATPAGFSTHNVFRANYPEISRDMLMKSRLDVIMGCGDPRYDNDGKQVQGKWNRSRYVVDSLFWDRLTSADGRVSQFTIDGKQFTVTDSDFDGRPDAWTLVQSLEDFRKLTTGDTPKRVLGVPAVYETLQYGRTKASDEAGISPPFIPPLNDNVPFLHEMALGALNVLDNNKKGFFLMIEGGAIDWAGHGNQSGRLIEEMADFSDAVDSVIHWIEENSSWEKTLLIVTSDHETGLLWGNRPFEPLSDRGKGNLPEMKFYSKDHTNSLVPFFAKGCGSEFYRIYADEWDSVRGYFIQNSEVAQAIKVLWSR